MAREFGYIRVSTKEQNTNRQLEQMAEKGITNLYIDKASGKDTNREQYIKMVHEIGVGDTLIVVSLDRLSRNLEDIKELYNTLSKRGAFIEVLDMPVLSTKGKSKIELDLVLPIIVQLLGYIAEQERLKIRERQAQGIAVMKVINGKKIGKNGIATGRPSKKESLTIEQEAFINAWLDKENKSFKLANAIEKTGLSRATLYRIKKIRENK